MASEQRHALTDAAWVVLSPLIPDATGIGPSCDHRTRAFGRSPLLRDHVTHTAITSPEPACNFYPSASATPRRPIR